MYGLSNGTIVQQIHRKLNQ